MSIELNGNLVSMRVLLDTGAISDNYITANIATSLNLPIDTLRDSLVCSGLPTPCLPSSGKVYLSLRYLNELTNTYDTFSRWYTVVELSSHDIIVGRRSVVHEFLIQKMYNQIVASTLGVEEGALGVMIPGYIAASPMPISNFPLPMSNPPSRLCAFPYPSEYDQPRPTVTVGKGMYFDPHDTDELDEIEEILDEYDLNQEMEDISQPESIEERMPVDVQGNEVQRERYRAL